MKMFTSTIYLKQFFLCRCHYLMYLPTAVINVSSTAVTAPSTGSGNETITATTLVNGEIKIIIMPAYMITLLLHT